MELKTHAELYAELMKESHGRLANMAADFVLQLRAERAERADELERWNVLNLEKDSVIRGLEKENDDFRCRIADLKEQLDAANLGWA